MIKQFTTKSSINYTIVLKNDTPYSIIVECPQKQVFYFKPIGQQLIVTDAILKQALRVLLDCNPCAFDILSDCWKKKEYYDIAKDVLKEHIEYLYNMTFAKRILDENDSYENI